MHLHVLAHSIATSRAGLPHLARRFGFWGRRLHALRGSYSDGEGGLHNNFLTIQLGGLKLYVEVGKLNADGCQPQPLNVLGVVVEVAVLPHKGVRLAGGSPQRVRVLGDGNIGVQGFQGDDYTLGAELDQLVEEAAHTTHFQ